ncbi:MULTISPECIES: hypothetical protein [unclassified Streptomyces]|uniref:hypothetical protein n=1 Tax=unclassified Streptomyces TaxID=2593676 RepID=UPI0038145A64
MQVVRSDKAATSGEAAVPGARPWHAILADTPDLGSWSTRTRTRHLELGYQGGSSLAADRPACPNPGQL